MATFRKRGKKWTAEICVKTARKTKTFETKAEAKIWAAQAEHELRSLADGASKHHTLNDVFERYADEISAQKKGEKWELIRLRAFQGYQLAKLKLIDLRREHLEEWIEFRLKSVKASSVNRELNLMSHCLTQARRWRLMKHNPMDDIRRPKNPPPRDRRITQEEIDAVCIALNYSDAFPVTQQQQRAAVAFLFAIETAMRAGEICGLRECDINEDEKTAYLQETKNGLPRYVPLSPKAIELIGRLKPWTGREFIFNIKSGSLSTTVKKAIASAGIENLTFHDTRHEATTRLAKKFDVLDLARVTGHRDIKQLMTYYNATASDLAKRLQ